MLWTNFEDQAAEIHKYLSERLQDAAKPLAVAAIGKAPYLDSDDTLQSIEKLSNAILAIVNRHPALAVLLDWEEGVLDAAGNTVSSILKLADRPGAGSNEEIARLLANLAIAAVGEKHVEDNRFRAVNEALLPILADRIAFTRAQRSDGEAWQAVVSVSGAGNGPSLKEAAALNRLLHIAVPESINEGSERGAVVALPAKMSAAGFMSTSGLASTEAIEKQFGCKEFTECGDVFRWVLVQSQAACDYAQKQPGPIPFYLGLCLPATKIRKGQRPAALWCSPCFEWQGESRHLLVNARFPVSLAHAEAVDATPVFRLREQLLNALIYHVHNQGARPGYIEIRGK